MELTELESILKRYDEKIDKNISINRDILKKLIIDKPSKYIQTERLKALYQLCSPLLLAILLAIIIDFTNIKVSATLNFYIGLVLFIPPFIFIWSLNIKHFLIIRKIKSWKLWKSNKKSDSHEPDSSCLIIKLILVNCKYKSYFSSHN